MVMEMDAAEQRMDAKLALKSASYRRNMRAAFKRFKVRFGLSGQDIYDKVRAIERGVVLGEMESFELDWLPNLVQTLVYERIQEGVSVGHAKDIHKAMRAFCKYNRIKYEMDTSELPVSESIGKMAFSKDQIIFLLDYAAGRFRKRNKAMMIFLKDSGLRPHDLMNFTIGNYKLAKRISPVDGFAVFNAIITSKKGVRGYPHIGPDAVEAIDEYLADTQLWDYFRTRMEINDESPLFIAKDMEGSRGRHIGFKVALADDITPVIRTMLEGSQMVNHTRYGAYSLRKYHMGRLQKETDEGPPMPLTYIYKLQGRKVKDSIGTYDRPEENGDLTESYIKHYYKLSLKDTTQEKEVKRLEREKEDLKEKLYLAEKTLEIELKAKAQRASPQEISYMIESGLDTPQKVAASITPEMLAQAIASNPELLKQALASIQGA